MKPSSRPAGTGSRNANSTDRKPAAASAFGNRKTFSRRRKSCPFSGANAPAIDYKDVRMLQRFVTERGKIMPKRITGVSAKSQRALSVAIKRARFLGLLAYVNK
jgi:small subunit ribosomal protein S18